MGEADPRAARHLGSRRTALQLPYHFVELTQSRGTDGLTSG